jgi:D-aminopeptidase
MNRRQLLSLLAAAPLRAPTRKRIRELGLAVGPYAAGARNSITDVAGVRVGHATVIRPPRIRTGVTAVLPHGGNLFQQKVPGAVFVGNGFGKLMGSTQVNELGEIETPILLTATLNVPRVADALLDYMLALPGNGEVRSINPLVGETNDGVLNDIRARAVGREEVFAAIREASESVTEGAVGAGAGTVCFGWKGGIGTSSRAVNGVTIGALVQSNYGGRLRIGGVPMDSLDTRGDGSIIIVLATDAPMSHRGLMRLAARSMLALGRTGSSGSNGSGDYAIAFPTQRGETAPGELSPLFDAAIDAVEEAIDNSLLMADDVTSNGMTVRALPVEKVRTVLKAAGVIP